jgi:zinc-binding alcohol dehydrogenase/oxidoreductase
MRALVVQDDYSLAIVEKTLPTPKPGEALIKIQAAALNRRDLWIQEGKYPNITPGATLGSDGAGSVEAVGSNEDSSWLHKQVLINPNLNWGSDPDVQSADYTIIGMPTDGTLAEYVVTNIDRLHAVPSHLDLIQASSLPLGGLTAFRALFRYANISAKSNVFISGFGGGVAQFAGLFALATGAQVYISSSQTAVRENALNLGVIEAFNYREKDWLSKLRENGRGMDLVIDSAGGDQINDLIKMLNPGGKVVFYGATTGLPSKINLHQLFWKQAAIQGTTMGNDTEFGAMIEFIDKHDIVPIIGQKAPFEQVFDALENMASGHLIGKSVLTFD